MHCLRLAEVQLKDGLLDAVYCDAGDPVGDRGSSPPLLLPRVTVEEVMSRNVTCVRSDCSLDAVTALFVEAGVDVLPVVGEGGALHGFVREADVQLDIHARAAQAETAPRTVADVMLAWPVAIREQTALTLAAAVLAYEHQPYAAVICTAGEVIGLVSSGDILRWLARADGYAV